MFVFIIPRFYSILSFHLFSVCKLLTTAGADFYLILSAHLPLQVAPWLAAVPPVDGIAQRSPTVVLSEASNQPVPSAEKLLF